MRRISGVNRANIGFGRDLAQYLGMISTPILQEHLRERQTQRGAGDIRDISQYGQHQQQLSGAEELQQALMGMAPQARQQYQGPTPNFPAFQQTPQMRTQFGMQELAKRLDPLYQARTKYYQEGAKARTTPKPTKIQELVGEGYTREEARMIRDISHGLKPRASARKQYEGMDDVDKMSFLSTLKQRAEGQYYGIEGGNVQPRQPKLLKWVNEELGKLPMLKTEKGKTTTDDWQLQGMITPEMRAAEPQSQEEFLETVKSIEDEDEARAYYDKWASKWQ